MKTIVIVSQKSPLDLSTSLISYAGASLSLKIVTFPTVEILLSEMALYTFTADTIIIDSEMYHSIPGLDPYDILQTISTLVKCSPRINGLVPIGMMVDEYTKINLIKELINVGIKNIFPQGTSFTTVEKEQAILDILTHKTHIPKKIKNALYNKAKNQSCISLTPRQEQILDLVSNRGISNKVIAKMLQITESTVKLHISAIFKKYGVRNRTQLAVFVNQQSA